MTDPVFPEIAARTACLDILHFLCAYHFFDVLLSCYFSYLRFTPSLTFVSSLWLLVWVNERCDVFICTYICSMPKLWNAWMFRCDICCACSHCIVLYSAVCCFPSINLKWSAHINHSCASVLKFSVLYFNLCLNALWIAYPFPQYNFLCWTVYNWALEHRMHTIYHCIR
jgi:hypothetical protein